MIIASTGHRPDKLGGYKAFDFERLVDLAEDYLCQHKVLGVISGLALGWDQALATASIRLNIPLVGAIPFVGQQIKWSSVDIARYEELLLKCNQIVYCDTGLFANWKFQKRNEWMVDRLVERLPDVRLVALWDGSEGGTKNCIDHAKKFPELQIDNLYNIWKR